ncbi:MAG: nucleoside diphosphate kinase regulator [Cognaticolwellia sp.]
MAKPKIMISEEDYDGIHSLMEKSSLEPVHTLLVDELERAKIVTKKQLPDNVVRMNSIVTFSMNCTKKIFSLKLVYPSENAENDSLSIFSPVGSALIGLSTGQEIEWPLENNRTTIVHIDAIR